MGKHLSEHISAIFHYWWAIVPLLMSGLLGLVIDASPAFTGDNLTIPLWAWIAIALAGIPIAQFLAYNKVVKQRDNLQAQLDRLRDDLLGNLSLNRLHFGFGNSSEDNIDVQPGIYLLNSANVAVQYNVTEITAIVSNRAINNPKLRMRTGVIQSGKERLFLYAVIPDVPKTFPTECTIKYTVQYGPLTEEYTHELSEALTVTLDIHTHEPGGRSIDWVYLVDASDCRRL